MIFTTLLSLLAISQAVPIAPAPALNDTQVDTQADAQVSNQGKKLFIGWDRVHVVKGEEQAWYSDGDEPVLAVMKLQVTTGTSGSTKISWITENAGEIDSDGLKNGQSAEIQNHYGDAWFDIKPFSLESMGDSPDGYIHFDIGLTVGFALESDLTTGLMNHLVLSPLLEPIAKKIGKAVEDLQIPITDITDGEKVGNALKDLFAKVESSIQFETCHGIVLLPSLINRYWTSFSDPDDVVGLAIAGFIPVADGLLDGLKSLGISPKNLGLRDDWTMKQSFKSDLGVGGWFSTDVWFGLLDGKWKHESLTVKSDLIVQDELEYRFDLTAAVRV